MSYDYEEYRFTSNVNIGSESGLYAGFVSKVDGEVGSAFTIATAEGAMVGLFQITVADGAIAAVAANKTTEQNKGKLKLTATDTAPASPKAASKLPADQGFDALATAVDGTEYHILTSSAYVVVNSSQFSYTLSAAQSVEAKEFFEEVKSYLGSNNWRADWQKISDATLGTGVDVLTWIYDNMPKLKSLLQDCNSILGEVPVVTYELDVKNGVDTEAPIVDPESLELIAMGTKVKAECYGAVDNFFVYGFDWQILDASQTVVGEGSSTGSEVIRPGTELADADYTFKLRAFDYAGNKSDWVSAAITINNNLYVDGETINEATEPVPISQEQEVEEDTLTYTFTPEYSGSYNLILQGLDNKAKVTITEYELGTKPKKVKSKSMTASNFMKGTGRVLFDMGKAYDITITSKYAASFTIAVEGEAFVLANQVPEDNWSDMKTIQEVTPDMKVTVNSPDQTFVSDEWVGFTDKVDVRELTITTASKLDIQLTANNKSKLTVYARKGEDGLKKLKSVSISRSSSGVFVTKSISNLLLDVGTYFIAVEAPNAKKGVNANYSVQLNASGTEFFEAANPYEQGVHYLTAETPAEGWIGFGGAVNSFNFQSANGGAFKFDLTDTNASVRMTVYDAAGKTVRKVTSKNGTATTDLIMLEADQTYLVEVENKQAKKGIGSNYKITVADQYEYNKGNNTKETAEVLTTAGVKGIVSSKVDATDWYDLSNVSGTTLELESVNGSLTAAFYDISGTRLTDETLKKGESIELTPAEFNAAFVEIESNGKKENLYSLAVLA